VIMTPHIAGWTQQTFLHLWAAIDENFRRLAAGEPLHNVVKAAIR
jgi:phosphoglycerate dehydrogenase-like enzyme